MIVNSYWTWTKTFFGEPLLVYISPEYGGLLPPTGVYILPGDIEFGSNDDLVATSLPKNWEMVYLDDGYYSAMG